MLLPWEIKCSITRAPVRSVLIACVSALLVCGMALYLRNIQITEETLDDLGVQKPVTVRVTNRDGSLSQRLAIPGKAVDYLLESGVRDPVYTTTFSNGQTKRIHGTNTLDSLDGLSPEDFTFLEGWDGSFPASGKPVLAVREDVAGLNGWELGDKLYLDFSMLDWKWDFSRPVGSYPVTLIAVYPEEASTVGAIMPADWLRGIAEIALPEDSFKYDSFHAVLEEPKKLNAYKDAAEEWGFFERSAVADPDFEGDTLSVEDEMYIKTAGELMETLGLYRAFLPPFIILVALIMAMVTFLALRSCRPQIAVLSSLGRPRLLNAAAHFCGAVIVQLAGCLLSLLALTLTLDLPAPLAGVTLGVFGLCALGGTAAGLLFLFRFDTLTLLTKAE